MRTSFGLAILILVIGCGFQARRDEKSLDFALKRISGSVIVEFGSLGETNIISNKIAGPPALAIAASFDSTNRMSAKNGAGKSNSREWIAFLEKDTPFCTIRVEEDGTFRFGHYWFKTKLPIPTDSKTETTTNR